MDNFLAGPHFEVEMVGNPIWNNKREISYTAYVVFPLGNRFRGWENFGSCGF